MKLLKQKPVKTLTVTEALGRFGPNSNAGGKLFVQVYKDNEVSILTRSPVLDDWGFTKGGGIWSTVTSSLDLLADRLVDIGPNCEYYLFDSLVEFARAVIENNWTFED
jgi:hypothetical protein